VIAISIIDYFFMRLLFLLFLITIHADTINITHRYYEPVALSRSTDDALPVPAGDQPLISV